MHIFLCGDFFMQKGKLIVIMGCDGTGKTTLLKNIDKYYSKKLNIVTSSGFGDKKYTAELEKIAKEQGKNRKEIFSADLRSCIWLIDLLNSTLQEVTQYLQEGKIVILDRYCLCARIYAKIARDAHIEHLYKAFEILPKPDLGIFLDGNIKVIYNRLLKRNLKIAPHENPTKLNEIRNEYIRQMRYEDYPIFRLNANYSEMKLLNSCMNIILNNLNKNNQFTENKYILN